MLRIAHFFTKATYLYLRKYGSWKYCNSDLMHNIQRAAKGQVLNNAKIVREKFTGYFNNEDSVPWQDKFVSLNSE